MEVSDFSQIIPWLPPVGGVVGVVSLWAALRSARRKRLVDDLPTSKTTGVFIGLVELKGTAESGQPLTSYLAGQRCVYYQWSVEEHWSRTVTETYTDSKGNTQTRTRHESGWKTVAEGGEEQPFYLKDDCGIIQILPEGAKIEPQTVFEETCGQFDPLYYGKGPEGCVSDSDFRRRFVERAVLLHSQLYVMGQARERSDMVAAEIADDKNAPMFLISTRSEQEISSSFGWGEWGWGFLGLVLCVAGVAVWDRSVHANSEPNWVLFGAVAAAYLSAAMGGWVWMAFNSLIDLRQRVKQGWAQVDVQLKRRFDLIPNLVNTIKGLRDYEQNLQTELAGVRTQSEATPPGETGPDFQSVQPVLVALAERYPELTAQSSFLELQKTLSDTEQRIALARGYYNEIATYYNTRLEIVPDRWIAALVAMKPQTLMAANDFERAPVEVSLVNEEQASEN